jgi:phage FluMu protein Com
MFVTTEGNLSLNGSDLCLTFFCPFCEEEFRIDGEFLTYIKCPKCKEVYKLMPEIKLLHVDKRYEFNYGAILSEAKEADLNQ